MARRLDELHRRFIAAEIARHVLIAADDRHSMRRVSRFLIDSLLWCWTADGIDDKNEARRDLLKYDCDHQRHTEAARLRWERNGRKGAGLRHEHVVPKRELITLILRHRATEHEVFEILTRMCFAVVVTKEQDDELSRSWRDRMPFALAVDTADELLFGRYEAAGLRDLVRPPANGSFAVAAAADAPLHP